MIRKEKFSVLQKKNTLIKKMSVEESVKLLEQKKLQTHPNTASASSKVVWSSYLDELVVLTLLFNNLVLTLNQLLVSVFR